MQVGMLHTTRVDHDMLLHGFNIFVNCKSLHRLAVLQADKSQRLQ